MPELRQLTHKLVPVALAVSIVLIGFLTYHQILGYFFTAPDALTQIDTARVHSFHDVVRILSEPMMNNTKLLELVQYYRPTAIFSYSIDYALWGLNPFGYHLMDLMLHISVAVLLFVFIRSLTGSLFVAWLGAVLFVIHPVHVENVPAVARRHDALAMFFMLIALLLFMRNYRGAPSRAVRMLSAVAFVLALGSKEIAAIFPVVVFGMCAVTEFPAERPRGRTWIRPWLTHALKPSITYFIITFIYVAWHVYVIGGLGGEQSEHFEQMAGPVPIVIAHYFRGLLDPYQFIGAHVNVVAHALFWTFIAVWIFARFGKRGYATNPPSSVARPLVFFVIWLLLPLGVPILTGTFQIRHIYVPVIPMMAILALVVRDSYAAARLSLREFRAAEAPQEKLRSRLAAGTNGLMFAVSVLLCLSLLAYSPLMRNYAEWRDSGEFSRKFLERISEIVPDLPNDASIHIHDLPFKFLKSTRTRPSVQTPAGLLDYSIKSWIDLNFPGNKMDVVLHRRRMVELPPSDVHLDVTRGAGNTVELHVKLDFPSRIDELQDYRDLGASYADLDDYANAVGYLETYVDSVPDDYLGWGLLGEAYYGVDRDEEAERCLRHSLELNHKNNYEGYFNLSGLLRQKRAHSEAIALCLDWAKYMPEDAAQAYRGVAWSYTAVGNVPKAIEFLHKSLSIEKNTHTYWGLLTIYVDRLQQYDKAIKYAKEWVAFDRRDANAYLMLGLAYYHTNHLDKAIHNLERCLELGQRREDARYRAFTALAETKTEAGDLRGSLKTLLSGTVAFPDSADMYCRVAEAQALLGKCEAAREWLGRAVDRRLSPGRRTQAADAIAACEQKRQRR